VIGTEVNAQVGYKLFDNLSVSAAAAYAFLGDSISGPAGANTFTGATEPDDPWLINTQLSYAF